MDISAARKLLEEKASQGKTLSYREFATELGINKAPIIRTCARMLDMLIVEDHNANRPILAALVVQQGSAGFPRRGFYQTLNKLGIYHGENEGDSALDWHQSEIKKLKRYYAAINLNEK
ncbi:MAG TPA: hypothetical protein ENK06_01675 [Gammaproteobacteria bacterium]|nr:hypothetical protein [Gammaproteobacteria bacterium]